MFSAISSIGVVGAGGFAWPLSKAKESGAPSRSGVVDLCVTIICGVGLVLATAAIVENPVIVISVVLVGTVILIAERTSRVAVRPWSPFHWMRWPRWGTGLGGWGHGWHGPTVWHYSTPTTHYYSPPYIYSPPPRQEGWLRDGHRFGLPVQG